jgi:hypothetical protein
MQADLYLDAVSFLEEARIIAPEDSEYPFFTFFNYTIELARRQRSRGGSVDPRLIQRWNDWWYQAERSPVFQDPSERSRLQGFQRDWLRLSLEIPGRDDKSTE